MNRKGDLSSTELGAIAMVGILVVIGAMVWMNANNSGPFYWFKTLMPNFDKPAVSEIALSGLIKYDVSANPVLQYYDGVKFQDFDSKNGEQVLVIGDKAFRYAKVSDAFNGYYFGDKYRVQDSGIKLTGKEASSLVDEWKILSEPLEITVSAKQICDEECVKVNPGTKVGDVLMSVFGNVYTVAVDLTGKKILMEKFPDIKADTLISDVPLYKAGNFVGEGLPYSQVLIDHAQTWVLSVISNPVSLNVYDYKNGVISDSCKSYSFPVSKVNALQGNGFVLTADLSKGTGSGACS